MIPSRKCVCERRSALIPVALSGLLALAGCGGGGGGGGPASTMTLVAYTYPPSLATATSGDAVSGFMSPYALNTNAATPQLDSVLPTVLGASASAGKIAITVSDILLPSGGTEPAFVVTFDSAAGSLLVNSPLDSVGCTGCLKTAQEPATQVVGGGSAGTVTFTYLDPSSPSFPLNYSTLGMWTKLTTVGSATWPEVGGAFSGGIVTRGVDLPTTGTAAYNGYFLGRYVTSSPFPTVGTYVVGANAHAQVDFSGAGAVTFSTSSTNISKELSGGGLGPPQPELNLNLSSASMTISRTTTSNSFAGGAGTLTNAFGMGVTGQIKGAFYGAPAFTVPYAPPEMGGSLAVSNSTNTQTMVGSFALKH